MRIGIDARRGFASGIGRVTSNLIEGIVSTVSPHEFVIFGRSDGDLARINSQAQFVAADFPFFSKADLYEFPRLVEKQNVEVFISPQFYISPYITCRSIKMIHDLWPVLHSEWIPGERDFIAKFGLEGWEGVRHFANLFCSDYCAGRVLSTNSFVAQSFENAAGDVRKLYMLGMMAATFESATCIPIPSLHTQKEILETFPEFLHKTVILPNYPCQAFHVSSEEKGNFILHVSKWERRKNIERLIDAISLVRRQGYNLRLVLVGDKSYPAYADELVKYMARDGQCGWIEHRGVVDDNELGTLYRSALMFVYPSLYEGFGIPILEAMACGTPVITSNRCSMPEVAGDAAILVDPTSVTEIARAIERLILSEPLRETLRHNGFKRLEHFTPAKAVAILLGIIEGKL